MDDDNKEYWSGKYDPDPYADTYIDRGLYRTKTDAMLGAEEWLQKRHDRLDAREAELHAREFDLGSLEADLEKREAKLAQDPDARIQEALELEKKIQKMQAELDRKTEKADNTLKQSKTRALPKRKPSKGTLRRPLLTWNVCVRLAIRRFWPSRSSWRRNPAMPPNRPA